MNSEKFIEFTSERRNRVLYPLPSQFVITQAKQKLNSLEALDPVSLSYPVYDIKGFTRIVGTISTPPSTIFNTIDNSVLVINTNDTTGVIRLSSIKNYYVGACIVVTNQTTAGAYISNTRRITSYEVIGSVSVGPNNDIFYNKAIITVSYPFPDSLLIEQQSANCVFSITNPSDFGDTNYAQLFIPNGLPQENAYINYYIMVDAGVNGIFSAKIIKYDEITHLAQLEPLIGFPLLGPPDKFYIVKDPFNVKFIFSNSIDYVQNTITFAGTETQDIFTNNWITFIKAGLFIGTLNYSSKIINYDIPTQTAKLLLPMPPGLSPPIYAFISKFSYDNVYPFTYNGTDREPKFYRVELINLILPNIILNVGYGGRIAFYPYVYVKMNNLSAFGRSSNLIMSNNPNANAMLFRCPINDVNHPLDSPFIKIDGNGMSQVFQFAPSDDLEFEVRLPNGELFQTEIQDFYSPSEPNYQVQISAIFRITKL